MTAKLGPALFVVLATFAYAQAWTVQTVAFQNYQEALETAAQLQALEYDAYVDFGLYEGQQFVRVRVGCFSDQDSAEYFARRLAGRVTAEAVAVPLDTKPGASFCVQRMVGFEPPESWDVLSDKASSVAFWVEVLGQRRFIIFDGAGWHVAQSEEELSSFSPAPAPTEKVIAGETALFQQDATSRILYTWRGRPWEVTTGKLLWQQGAWAVVLEDGAVAAYHIEGVD